VNYSKAQNKISVFRAIPAVVLVLAFLINNVVYQPTFKSALCKTAVSQGHLFCICPTGDFFRTKAESGIFDQNLLGGSLKDNPERKFTEYYYQVITDFKSDRLLSNSSTISPLIKSFKILLAQTENITLPQLFFSSFFNKAPPVG